MILSTVENGRIVVYISFMDLAFAAENHPGFWDGESGIEITAPNITVTNPAEFAQEVVEQLNREDEDGSTMVTKLLDDAISEAINSGCEGVSYRDAGKTNRLLPVKDKNAEDLERPKCGCSCEVCKCGGETC